ncbi:MAG: precorrin-6A reductase [Eubacteriales bacterium]|nr:precorrin-6A reductase [Eubacteriales bacterium]
MCSVFVFAGTTEGYEISRFLAEHEIFVQAFVATEYGAHSLKESRYLKVFAGRLTQEEMEERLTKEKPRITVDATHPYAAVVTENIRRACEKTQVPYVRLLREQGEHQENAVYVDSTEAAAAYLCHTEGAVLVTTGSKELAAFTVIPDYKERVFARVLSLPKVAASCSELGFEGKHLICMQGPFTREMNEAMLRQYDCRYLVTKDTGKAGGFQEKIEAAFACGAIPVIIGRPLCEEGLSLEECRSFLQEELDLPKKQKISLVGIGMGSEKGMTIEAREVLSRAQVIIGASRMIEAAALKGQETFAEYRAEAICDFISRHPEYERIAIVLSGDVGFYSGARKLLSLLGQEVQIVCGISSVAYFMSRIGLSWDDARIVSAHGRDCNLVSWICREKKVFSIMGTRHGVRTLAGKLAEYGMGDVLLYVGECLSYPEEKIFCARAAELTEYEGNPLSVICAVNEAARPLPGAFALPDEAFVRGKAPMTKEEIRTISISKLRLLEDSVCYDIGAGTGSVAIEMALRAHQGRVYAIEKKEEAVRLLYENKKRFAVDNLCIISGTAPDAMRELEPPTHAFIGGSSGNLREIMELLLEKNAEVSIVMNCITLETVSEALQAAKELSLTNTEIVQISAAHAKSVGRYHMMMGENPIYIFACHRSGA